MIRIEAVVLEVSGIDVAEVADWIARGWVEPAGSPPHWSFGEIDVARVRLVRDLRHDAGLDEDSLGLVLSLLDQVYALRRRLLAVRTALAGQPEPVRRAILDALPDEA